MSISGLPSEKLAAPALLGDGRRVHGRRPSTRASPPLLVGQAFWHRRRRPRDPTLKSGSVGNGTIALDPYDPVLAGAVLGTYKAVFHLRDGVQRPRIRADR